MVWVAILMGSDSDWPVMEIAADTLEMLGVPSEVRVTSAHRTPRATADYVEDAQIRGCQVFICGAGMAAHLAGAVAALTTRPVIGVPIDSGSLAGFDALLSTVQMPGGIPVGTLAIGKPGAINAALLAIAILANSRPELRAKLKDFRAKQAAKVRAETLP